MTSSKPAISVIMPAFNSAKTIGKSLQSVRNQDYDQEKVEILVIDGGSNDATREIAKEYDVTLLENPQRQQEYAKGIGIMQASGKYLIFLDSDEVLENTQAFNNRTEVFNGFKDVKFIHSSGYKKPAEASFINDYINNFSDPFTFFMQGIATEHGILLSVWQTKYTNRRDFQNYTLFNLLKSPQLPVVDMCAGNTIETAYIKDLIAKNGPLDNSIPKLFYLIVKSGGIVAMLHNDPIVHYSADTLKNYISKIRWRITVNTHYKDIPGTGFSNREEFQSKYVVYKKYLFVAYALSVIVPLVDSFRVYMGNKKLVSFLHVPLAFYTGVYIVYQQFLKTLGVKPKLRAYGKVEMLNDTVK